MNMITEMNSSKTSFESSFFNESPLVRSRTSSFSTNNATSSYTSLPFFSQQNNQQCYTGSGHLEEDKKARTELITEIANDDLYCPVQPQQKKENTSSRGLNSFLPRNYNGVMESTNSNDTWAFYQNDMFNTTNNMFSSFDGINSVACQ
ncbi:15757_t:CDS:2 [Funneliformis caledonium]|uniref:15757_t:CDS:1 n=1 Tax=Funneliformis caledonium TaxID=1117310 RepID=A0A9N9C4X8_9GLOM|nr:15757_t:CDS:2 [Funneliformis caledonium]